MPQRAAALHKRNDGHDCAPLVDGRAEEHEGCTADSTRGLTFDMSGGAKGAKRPLGRPLDGGVRFLVPERAETHWHASNVRMTAQTRRQIGK